MRIALCRVARARARARLLSEKAAPASASGGEEMVRAPPGDSGPLFQHAPGMQLAPFAPRRSAKDDDPNAMASFDASASPVVEMDDQLLAALEQVGPVIKFEEQHVDRKGYEQTALYAREQRRQREHERQLEEGGMVEWEPGRPLPTARYNSLESAFAEAHGRLNPNQILELLSNARADPAKWTAEALAREFCIEPSQAELLLRHTRVPRIIGNPEEEEYVYGVWD